MATRAACSLSGTPYSVSSSRSAFPAGLPQRMRALGYVQRNVAPDVVQRRQRHAGWAGRGYRRSGTLGTQPVESAEDTVLRHRSLGPEGLREQADPEFLEHP